MKASDKRAEPFRRGFKKGDIVLIAEDLDAWQRGNRAGIVTKVGKRWIKVKLHKNQWVEGFHPAVLTNVSRDFRNS